MPKVIDGPPQQNKNSTSNKTNDCNCREKEKCVLDNKCKKGPVIYRANIKNARGKTFTYIGCTEDFKKRYANHKTSFKNEKLRYATRLSNFVWENNLEPTPEIKWSIEGFATPYRRGGRYCDLCLSEKLTILRELKNEQCLNKRMELNDKCVHILKHRLKNI